MSDDELRLVDWLVDRFYVGGVRQVFGVPGGGTSLDLMEAARRRGLQTVVTAREDAAVIMAGVSGVLANHPGLAFSTKGPGLSSSANGLASARLDRMPVLLATETFAPGERDYVTHQVFDQSALVTPLLHHGEADVLAPNVDSISNWLAATRVAQPGPAVMFPTARSLSAPVRPPTLVHRARAAHDADAIARARQLLSASNKPLAIVGLEAAQASLGPSILALLARYNMPALTTYMACGTVPGDSPNCAGVFTGGALEQPLVHEADLIVFLGLDPVELIRKPWPYDAAVLDVCETEHKIHYVEPATRVLGGLRDSLSALTDEPRSTPVASAWTQDEVQAHREQMRGALRIKTQAGLNSDQVVFAAAAALAPQRRLAIDAGAHMFSASAFWPAMQARDILISNGLASMGFAIPAAIAAALHDPERGAVAMTGDGGALMCLGELKTAAQVRANLCIIIFNDGCLSLIDIKREERQMLDLGLTWEAPDFAAIAAGFGLQSWRAETIDELGRCCAEAAKLSQPCLIDARIHAGGYADQMRALRG